MRKRKGQPSNVITLPTWLSQRSKYITKTGGDWGPETVALCLALSLRIHGTVDQVRVTARRLAERVCREQEPKLKGIAREPDDSIVVMTAESIVNRVCDLLEIDPEYRFTSGLEVKTNHENQNQ
ncbi:hypothetical protein ZC03_067 [Pseudomonas phage ZC03]|uniref:DUF7740 domain-containing protein n=2 Tax=Zicotriavirus TaxID=2843161 RepID=A0A1L2C961_9CAUD|nr:hypothetical protein HWA93_gp62 [Pseudomonas phage ZC03]YP_009830624.1 hypothetical protein HWA94_gp64 [Pseudomonas phage ZC08]AMD43444.1 hypothetical protein ZC03_067 [Pseudomonas phage ZC03]AMD43503.1 hypothetical protein ZC08_062 [Pseudomonas phage ZC08]